MKTFVMAKYRTRTARTQNIFVRKCTWPSGRVPAEVVRLVLHHGFELVFVEARIAGPPAASRAAAVLLAAAVGATAAKLAGPRDHPSPPSLPRRASGRAVR